MRSGCYRIWLLLIIVSLASRARAADVCVAEGRNYPEGVKIESYLVTGVRTRTVVPIYIVCRGGTWIWPGTNEPVQPVRKEKG